MSRLLSSESDASSSVMSLPFLCVLLRPVIMTCVLHVLAESGNAGKECTHAENRESQRSLIEEVRTKAISHAAPPLIRHKINVTLTPWLYVLDHIDEADSTARIKFTMFASWGDPHTVWNPDLYCGLHYLTFKSHDIDLWRPPFILGNSLMSMETAHTSTVEIQMDGNVTLSTVHLYIINCEYTMSFFPFDYQDCHLRFWFEADFDIVQWAPPQPMKIDYLTSNARWQIMGLSEGLEFQASWMYHNERVNDTIAKYHLLLKRLPMYYIFTLVVPVICLTTLGVVIFILPPNSGTKMNICFTLLLAFYVLFAGVSSLVTPHSNELPIFFVYTLTMFVLICIFTMIAAVVQMIHQAEKLPHPFCRMDPPHLAFILNSLCLVIYPSLQVIVIAWTVSRYQEMPVVTPLPDTHEYIYDNRTYRMVLTDSTGKLYQPGVPD